MSRHVPALRACAKFLPHFNPGLTAGAISCRPAGPGMFARVAGLLFAVWTFATVAAAEPTIRLVEKDKSPVAFEVVALPAGHVAALAKAAGDEAAYTRTLSVYVGKESQAGQPAIIGHYELQGDVLRFTPRYALRPGLAYRAEVFLPAADAARAPSRYEKIFEIPAAPAGESARVAAVFPSASTLPENQLRFYLHFATPMARGEAYEHLRLLKENGQPVFFPFLEIGEELWDTSGKRLTLLVDPGRIKRGLQPREEHGPVLEAGHKYTLVVTKGWRDAAGQPLAEDYKKTFTAGPPVETAIDPKTWKIVAPRAASAGPLEVQCPRGLDHALLQRTITVIGPGGKPLDGEITIGKDERLWRFQPDQPWSAGKHELVIDTTLEDQAGNRIGRPFEVDQFNEVDRSAAAEFIRLPLEIRPAGK